MGEFFLECEEGERESLCMVCWRGSEDESGILMNGSKIWNQSSQEERLCSCGILLSLSLSFSLSIGVPMLVRLETACYIPSRDGAERAK